MKLAVKHSRSRPSKPHREIKGNFSGYEEALLAPYAVKSSGTKGRQYPEKEHALRTPFQRDRDRIIHSTAFRRLQYKTQVFVNHEGDHYRTRLTHTIETSQIARTIARTLRLNEDLVETIALAHDIGHGPFGHAGEWALEDLMKGHGGFEHNIQALRIVEHLEESYPEFSGLNLTFETREGLKKHPEHFFSDRFERFRSLEADLVDVSDGIAYNTHDLDDGLRSELITEEQLSAVELWRNAVGYIQKKYDTLSPLKRKRLAIRLIVNHLVMDLIQNTQGRIQKLKVQSLVGLQKIHQPIIDFSEEEKKRLGELKKFLHKNLYSHERVVRETAKGQKYLRALFQIYLQKPSHLPVEILKRSKKEKIERVICDYVAGMTDRFALDEYKRLCKR